VLPAILAISTSSNGSSAADRITLQFKHAAAQGEVGFHSPMALPVSAMYPEYTILRSTNLVNWQVVAGPIRGSTGVSDELLRVAVPLAGNHASYRVRADVNLAPPDSRLGDAIYGYGTEFGRQLQLLGQLPLSEFVSRYLPTNQYLAQIDFDPTTAEFWNEFNTYWPLSTNEFSVFQTNGFVVSPRLGSYSFADAFYNIYAADLPVFVSCDAILHAWHRSYVTMLQELEETYLAPCLQEIIESMSSKVTTLDSQYFSSLFQQGLFSDYLFYHNAVVDVDFFLAVARSLATGTNYYRAFEPMVAVNHALAAINGL